MPIPIQAATAICHDCRIELTGGGEIGVVDISFFRGVGSFSGELLFQCANHHDTNRQWGERYLSQHNTFTIYEGNREVGITSSVSSFAAEAMITITGESYLEQLRTELRSIQKERGF